MHKRLVEWRQATIVNGSLGDGRYSQELGLHFIIGLHAKCLFQETGECVLQISDANKAPTPKQC